MKILLLGKNGQVGWELQRSLAPLGQLVALDHDGAPGLSGDFAHPESLAATVRSVAPDLIVNAAGHTAVDKAESEPEFARALNAQAPFVLAREAAACGALLVHYSTDYVFDGSGDVPRAEDAPTGPLSVYGATKLAGEEAIAAAGGQWAVMRTSWVFSAHGSNFVKTMLRLGAERDRLTIVADQIGGPTPAADIAAALTMIRAMQEDPAKGGLYHFAGAPDVSWADFAREIFAQAGLAPEVADIPTADYPTPARRPLNSRLDCGRIARDFGIPRPDWRAALARELKEMQQ